MCIHELTCSFAPDYRGEYFFSVLISCGRNIFSLSLFLMESDISSLS
jgi:hypothetical protein